MEMNEYQKLAIKTAFFTGDGIVYCTLGLTGEAGEVAEHVKKMIRDENGEMSQKKKELLLFELGDVLWYLANLANSLDTDLNTIAELNLKKLHSRLERGTHRGSGDKR